MKKEHGHVKVKERQGMEVVFMKIAIAGGTVLSAQPLLMNYQKKIMIYIF
ncbi:hypothetical protein [Peribacillus frigoritolerans]